MPAHVVAELACDALERLLERGVRERVDPAAVVAHEVVVMFAAGMCGLEARDAVADVDPLHQAQLGELVERAVDAGDPGPSAAGADAREDLLRRETATLPAEVLHDGLPRTPLAQARFAKPCERTVSPGTRRRTHPPMIAVLKVVLRCRTVVARIVLITIVTAVLSGCGGASGPGSRTVVAAFYPLAFAAEQVAGEGIVVIDLTPPGAEPHDLELAAGDVKDVRDAELVLYLGQGFMPSLERAAAQREQGSIDLLEGQELIAAAGEPGSAHDPHVWLDPARYAWMATTIAAALGDESLADGFVRRLDELDDELRAGLGKCARREIVTSHAAFGYLAERYRLEQVPLSGLSPEVEPSAREIEALSEQVRLHGATTVFFETLASPELAETVAREAGVKTAVLNPLEGLTGAEIDAGADYFSVMRDNLAALRAALGCS